MIGFSSDLTISNFLSDVVGALLAPLLPTPTAHRERR
jgi:hypothetical protein